MTFKCCHSPIIQGIHRLIIRTNCYSRNGNIKFAFLFRFQNLDFSTALHEPKICSKMSSTPLCTCRVWPAMLREGNCLASKHDLLSEEDPGKFPRSPSLYKPLCSRKQKIMDQIQSRAKATFQLLDKLTNLQCIITSFKTPPPLNHYDSDFTLQHASSIECHPLNSLYSISHSHSSRNYRWKMCHMLRNSHIGQLEYIWHVS